MWNYRVFREYAFLILFWEIALFRDPENVHLRYPCSIGLSQHASFPSTHCIITSYSVLYLKIINISLHVNNLLLSLPLCLSPRGCYSKKTMDQVVDKQEMYSSHLESGMSKMKTLTDPVNEVQMPASETAVSSLCPHVM